MSSFTPAPFDNAERMARWGRMNEAAELYRTALAGPLDARCRYSARLGLARTLMALGDADGALTACLAAIAEEQADAAGHAALAHIHVKTGRNDAAAAAAEEACRRAPRSTDNWCLLAAIALRDGQIERARAAAEQALGIAPLSQRARFLLATAELWQNGQAPDFEFGRLVSISRPMAPRGFGSIAAFNAALVEAISSGPLDPPDPGAPLEGGKRLHDILELPSPMATALRAIVLDAAMEHPENRFLGGNPRVRGWANLMHHEGFEQPHIHEGAVLSAVYYACVPPCDEPGTLVFGGHDLGGTVPTPSPFAVAPEDGLLVLFPSHIYHGTAPYRGTGARISVAIDLCAGVPDNAALASSINGGLDS